MNQEIGFFKYFTFGLRINWVNSFIVEERQFWVRNSLGPIQLKAFINYLKDGEIIDKKKNPTKLFNFFNETYLKEGIDSKLFWGVYWVNLCFNSFLFKWWANQALGRYSRDYLISLLSYSYGKMNRSVTNAYASLVSTLEKTPIGDKLGQGIVKKEGNKRVVIKKGNPDIPPLVILYNLYKLAENTGSFKFTLYDLEENSLSPQKIFSLDSKEIDILLKNLWSLKCLKMELQNENLFYILEENLNSIDILRGV